MHFQKKFFKGIAIMLSALMLTISITNINTIPVYAAEASAELTLTKVIDMALTKTGVIANNNWLQKIQASFLNMLNGTASSYGSYCEANGLEKNNESWVQYSTSEAYVNSEFYFANWIFQLTHFTDWVITGVEADDEIALQVLADTSKCVQGETYTLKDEAVEYVRDTFDDIVAEEGLGYYYVNVLPVSELPRVWYDNDTSYNNVVDYISSSDNITFIDIRQWSGAYKDIRYYDNTIDGYYVRPNLYYSEDGLKIYDSDYNGVHIKYNYCVFSNDVHSVTFNDYDSFIAQNESYAYNILGTYFYSGKYIDRAFAIYPFSKNGGQIKIFFTYNALLELTGNKRSYYTASNVPYDMNNDNSISYTGDYIINNGQNYSYDTVQNTIDNSVDNSTDESVTNIVNDSYNTIINNYYYTNPDSGEGGSGDSGDDSSGGGLGALIDGIGSILDFVVTLLGDVIGLIGGFLDTVYDLLKNLGGNFTNFSNLLGELFSFIPQELIDLISAGIGVMISVAVIRLIKG